MDRLYDLYKSLERREKWPPKRALHEVEVCPCGWYPVQAVTAKPAELPSEVIRAEQAARVGAMFERWAAEDVSDEPEWDVDQVERIRTRATISSVEVSRFCEVRG